ncbi:MAG: Mu transposase C-terminal domain-containing protein [Fischerella sp. CENA71]|nr:Mu transposase C-terminal domain-containing protein [Fischerella sp. CENA71]
MKTQPDLVGERELDICLMRRARRVVYRGGYIQFANLTYQGEHLAGYASEWMVIRYNPRDITTILIYQLQGSLEVFLTRAHAVGLAVLKQKSSPNVAQTSFVSSKHVTIQVQPINKSIRHGCSKRF